MATTIDQAFIKQFEREVHEAYQRQGSKLRNSVRNINQVKGSSTTFQKVGKGTASTKATHVYKRSEDKKFLPPQAQNFMPAPAKKIEITKEQSKPIYYNE